MDNKLKSKLLDKIAQLRAYADVAECYLGTLEDIHPIKESTVIDSFNILEKIASGAKMDIALHNQELEIQSLRPAAAGG